MARGIKSEADLYSLTRELLKITVDASLNAEMEGRYGKIIEWQSRPLEEIYPIIYLDCIVVKIRQDKRVINKAVYVALGINMAGHKELLGLWLSENEGAKFWLSVLTELKNRGIKDVFVACVDA